MSPYLKANLLHLYLYFSSWRWSQFKWDFHQRYRLHSLILLFISERYIPGELDYAYSGLSCNMSSTCYGGVYQGEYTPTEVKNIVWAWQDGIWIFMFLKSLKVTRILPTHILEFKWGWRILGREPLRLNGKP